MFIDDYVSIVTAFQLQSVLLVESKETLTAAEQQFISDMHGLPSDVDNIVLFDSSWGVYAAPNSALRRKIETLGYEHWKERFRLPAQSTGIEDRQSVVMFRDLPDHPAHGLYVKRGFCIFSPAKIPRTAMSGVDSPSEAFFVMSGEFLPMTAADLGYHIGIVLTDTKVLQILRYSDGQVVAQGGCALDHNRIESILLAIKSGLEQLFVLNFPERIVVEEMPYAAEPCSARHSILRSLSAHEFQRYDASSTSKSRVFRVIDGSG